MSLKTETTAQKTAAVHVTYVASKDRTSQIATVLNDELHRLCWGRLHTSNRPHEGLPVVDADAATWIRAERVKLPIVRPIDPANPYAVSGTILAEAA